MTPRTLDNRTLNRTLLARQGLLRRERRPVAEVIEHLVGMQSQIPGNPFVALWSRIDDFDPAELDTLMLERRVVRTSLMRTTLHLVTVEDALALRPLFDAVLERAFHSQRAFREGIEGVDLGRLLAAGTAALEASPMMAKQLGTRLAEEWPGRDPSVLAYAVRHLVPTVQVTPRGLWNRTMQPTMTTLAAWLGRPVPAAADPAVAERLVERYLRAFGPASVGDMRTWSWLTGLREVVDRVRPRLRAYRDERGRELLDVIDGPITPAEVDAPPRFLPEYDNLYLSHEDRSRIGGRWYDDLGIARGSLLVDGSVAGGWRVVRTRKAATVEVDLFRVLSPAERAAVETEADALLSFLAPEASPGAIELRGP